MIIAISGASGFIGQALIKKFRENGWTFRIIDRDSLKLPDTEFRNSLIEGSDAVINLAGAPVSVKWTEARKKEIYDSRINTTRKISENILAAQCKPAVFISGSAIGIYDSVHTHTESSTHFADTFLARVCSDWEKEALTSAGVTRVVLFRTGVVLGSGGGILEKIYFPFSIGLGGKIEKGKQPFSFIHLEDLVNAFLFVIQTPELSGTVNAVSPHPSTNAEFTEMFGKVLKQTTWLTIPPFALKMLLGEGALIMTEGQKVMPEKLLSAGFRFKYPTLMNTLVKIYR